ncbi:MAG: hypothetical protein ABSF32_11310 [Ignavibacteria bacterium]
MKIKHRKKLQSPEKISVPAKIRSSRSIRYAIRAGSIIDLNYPLDT